MSTKSTIFLTKDNEHCYSDCSCHHFNDKGEFIGDSIVIEFSKENAEIICNDQWDLVIELKPGSEIYNIISKIKK